MKDITSYKYIFQTHCLGVSLSNKTLLNEININIPKGKITAIIGANGAGKSTLLKTLTGEISPTNGQVVFNSKDMSSKYWSIERLSKYRSVLNQSISTNFPFKVKEIVQFGLDVAGIESNQSDINLQNILKKFNLNKLQNQNYLTLSGGEKKLTQLARVFAQIQINKINKSCILLDEWSESLDLKNKMYIINSILEYVANGGSSVMVLHDLNLVNKYAEHCICLKEGKVIAEGNAVQMLADKNILLDMFGVNSF